MSLPGIILRELTKEELQKFATQKLANMAKRSKRIQEMGMKTKDMTRVEEAKAQLGELKGEPGSKRNDFLKLAAKVDKLDRAPGVRVPTVAREYRKEREAERRHQLLSDLGVPAKASKMSREELKEAVQVKQKQMRDQARSTRRAVGETHAIRKFDEAREEFGSVRGKTRNELLSYGSRLSRISDYEGMTPAGARMQAERGVKWFGDQWRRFSMEEQGAIWDKVNEYSAAHEVRSEVAINYVKEQLDEMSRIGIAQPVFDRDPSTGKIRDVDFGFTPDESKAKQMKRRAVQSAISDLLDRSVEPMLKF